MVVALVAASCGTPQPVPTPSPAPTVECFEFVETGVPSTMPPRDVLDESSNVVVATFRGYEEAVWNTPDGTRPTREAFQEGARLVTPLALDVERALRGDAGAAARAVEIGGESGCDLVDYGWPDLVAGERYVILLGPLVDSTGAPSEHLLLLAGWPTDANDRVYNGDERIGDLKAVERRITRTDAP